MGLRILPQLRSLLVAAPLLVGVGTACARPASTARLSSVATPAAFHTARTSSVRAPHAAPACGATLHWPLVDGTRSLIVALDASAAPAAAVADADAQLDDALAQWNRVGMPLRLERGADTQRADVRVVLLDRLPAGDADARYLAGTTRLVHTERGAIARATVLLALHSPDGTPYSIGDRALIMLHELGHAMGLPHADDGTLMAARPVVWGITRRDERAARALYAAAAACREPVRLASRDED